MAGPQAGYSREISKQRCPMSSSHPKQAQRKEPDSSTKFYGVSFISQTTIFSSPNATNPSPLHPKPPSPHLLWNISLTI